MPIWQNLPDILLTLCSHEQEASYVACGYAKASGELTAVISTASPGVANCVAGIAGANMDSLPIIYISGKMDTTLQDKGIRQEESRTNRNFESTDLMRPITKTTIQITDIANAAEQFLNCCKMACSGRTGSVHVCIPQNIQSMDIPVPKYPITIEQIIHHSEQPIPQIRKPLIIIGWGSYIARAVDLVYSLAQQINAPILVTTKAYCCIMRNHPYFLGKLGYGYNPEIESFLKVYCATEVLAFGCSMSRKDISASCAAVINTAAVHVYTNDADSIKAHFPSAVIHQTGDLCKMLQQWLGNMPKIDENESLKNAISKCKISQNLYFRSQMCDSDTMAVAIDAIGRLGPGITLTADAGNNLLNTATLCAPIDIGGLFLNDGIRSMGSGLCETVGMSIANPSRYYIAVVGDGGMLMNGNVLYLIRKLNLPIAVVVMNNSSLGRVRVGQSTSGLYIGSSLGDVDFLLYAQAFGVKAARTTTVDELIGLLRESSTRKECLLVEYRTSDDEIPQKLKIEGVY